MPYVSKRAVARKSYKKRSYKANIPRPYTINNTRRTNPLLRIGPSGNGLYTTLKYYSEATLDPGAVGVASVQVFANSVFDCDVTGAGHQPAGLDPLFAFFEHCVVYQMDYKITYKSGTAGLNVIGVTAADTSYAAETDRAVMIENGSTQWSMINSDTENATILEGSVDCAKTHGISRTAMLGDNTYASTVAATPNDPVYLNVWAGGFNNQNTAACFAGCEITLHCYFYGSAKLPLS